MSARIEEIRTENHMGDVSARDIEWLCKVADVAERMAARYDPRSSTVVVDYNDLRLLRRTFGLDSTSRAVGVPPLAGPGTAT